MLYWVAHIGAVLALAALVVGLLVAYAVSLQATQLSYLAARVPIVTRHAGWDEAKPEALMMGWAADQLNPGFTAPQIIAKAEDPAVLTIVPWGMASIAPNSPKFSSIWREHDA